MKRTLEFLAMRVSPAFAHSRLFLVSLAISQLASFSAEAGLSTYEVQQSTLLEYGNLSPMVQAQSSSGIGMGVVNDDGSGFPVLESLVIQIGEGGMTTDVPSFSGFVWISSNVTEGLATPQTGTGSIASSIEWGDVLSWTANGGIYCHGRAPVFDICGLVGYVESETTSPRQLPPLSGLGSWFFHGTGFVADPFVRQTSTVPGNQGNAQMVLRGGMAPSNSVPALPLLGLAVVGLSVVALGVGIVRRR